MLSKQEIEEIVRGKIASDERLGEGRGGSGNLGYTSYALREVSANPLPGERTEIHYCYVIVTETEFTVEPDNPPEESRRSRVIVVDREMRIVSDRAL